MRSIYGKLAPLTYVCAQHKQTRWDILRQSCEAMASLEPQSLVHGQRRLTMWIGCGAELSLLITLDATARQQAQSASEQMLVNVLRLELQSLQGHLVQQFIDFNGPPEARNEINT